MAHNLQLIRSNNGRWKWVFQSERGDMAQGHITVPPSTKEAESELVHERLKRLIEDMSGTYPTTDVDET